MTARRVGTRLGGFCVFRKNEKCGKLSQNGLSSSNLTRRHTYVIAFTSAHHACRHPRPRSRGVRLGVHSDPCGPHRPQEHRGQRGEPPTLPNPPTTSFVDMSITTSPTPTRTRTRTCTHTRAASRLAFEKGQGASNRHLRTSTTAPQMHASHCRSTAPILHLDHHTTSPTTTNQLTASCARRWDHITAGATAALRS